MATKTEAEKDTERLDWWQEKAKLRQKLEILGNNAGLGDFPGRQDIRQAIDAVMKADAHKGE